MITKGMMSSNTPEWSTPQDFFDALDREFHFDVDVCANKGNAKCKRFFTAEDDGLAQSWITNKGRNACWMNPPYGRQIGKWIRKAFEESCRGNTVVCLVPARTDTAWWHDYCMKGEIRFIRGRLYFTNGNGAADRAPFPSAVVIFKAVQREVEIV